MKKTLFIASVLLVAVISTACMNNLAVQDLNNKAEALMNMGEYDKAIEKLKSSLDLDSSIFETHYNLAIAYTESEDYTNAIVEYKKAIKINPYNSDAYYSFATALNNFAVDMEQGRIRLNDKNEIYNPEAEDIDFGEKYEMSEKEASKVAELKQESINNYEKFLELNPESKDKDTIEQQIKRLQGEKPE